ncbi:glycosyltransferase [Flavihumibacter sp. UBA7668]|uniref:glycosyltransferase n=1 Tax=Flavihumibacter sp. UBA7668 TaxID=1946542 RepID=UPI0025C7370E|nr:nucleotide disphospho-sugar-binding domain-containing protein [Flavihumibacter sp. UBA7668]
MNPKKGRRILFANVPADGHFNPLTSLAAHLKAEGYEIAWYSSGLYAEKIRQLGILHFPFRKAMDINAATIDMILPQRQKIKGKLALLNFDMQEFFIRRGPEYYEDIAAIYEAFPFDLFIADCAFTGIPYVKDKMGISVLSIGIMPLMETSRNLAPPGLGLPPAGTLFGKLWHRILRKVILDYVFRPSSRLLHQLLDEHAIYHGNQHLFDLAVTKSDLYLQSGTPSFEFEREDLNERVRFIGPVLPQKKISNRKAWYDSRVESYERVVLITQGTFEKDTTKLLEPALEALRNSNYLVIITTGGYGTDRLRQQYLAPNIIIEDFIPFEEVMPYADVYVSNGGYGGVLLSIQQEVPLVVAGMNEGKSEINVRVGYFGLGINLNTERPTVKAIRNAVEIVLKEDAYRDNVKEMAREFLQYQPATLTSLYVRELLLNKRIKEPVRSLSLI